MKKTEKQEEEFKIFKTEEPFHVVRMKGKHVITMGNAIVSKKTFESYKKAHEYVKSKPYELIINATLLTLSLTEQKGKENEKVNEKAEAKN